MPKFRVYLAASVDGYIAETDGSVAWLDGFGSEDYGYEAFAAGIKTVIMGRTSFDQTVSFDVPWPYAGKRSLVMTHRDPPDIAPDDVSFVSGAAQDIAAGLEDTDSDVWLMG
ncbi:MAG: dihydrofolate reductase, partial [Alphaproteobacteria bacterium]|nr:dihydrofolate reductase [Alphaproteobacteria bacterium]